MDCEYPEPPTARARRNSVPSFTKSLEFQLHVFGIAAILIVVVSSALLVTTFFGCCGAKLVSYMKNCGYFVKVLTASVVMYGHERC